MGAGGVAGGTAGAAGGPVAAPGGTGKSGEAAGASGSPAANCNSTHPISPALITNFSDAMASTTSKGNYTFGSSGVAAGMMGGTSLYASGTTGTLSVSGGMLTFKGTVPPPTIADMTPYSGFEVYVTGPDCLNAGIFYGVKFTYMSTGPCPVLIAIVDSERVTPSNDPNRGICVDTGCYPDQFSPSQFDNGSGTIKLPFGGADPVTSGMPPGLDPSRIIGVEWQLLPATSDATTSCTGTITVGDISFY